MRILRRILRKKAEAEAEKRERQATAATVSQSAQGGRGNNAASKKIQTDSVKGFNSSEPTGRNLDKPILHPTQKRYRQILERRQAGASE